YNLISENEIDKYQNAQLISIKFNHEYITKYTMNNKIIALSISKEGKCYNLISFAETEVESRAKMILSLLEEGVLSF
ncbi:hypothetical protein, partial [Neptunitalea chrysea]|uniref:hypothetical protein n=1 Tax=Neptunitalea chrysea TaxID=1647581 RepID=UPI002493A5BF